MGAMKNIAIDIEDLHLAAVRAENVEVFMHNVTETGWKSPTEIECRNYQAARIVASLKTDEVAAVKRVLDALGIELPAVDFPFRDISAPNVA